MDGDFDWFMEGLMKAEARIEKYYHQVPVAGIRDPVFRERVYCYELYHQLRNVLGDNFPYKLYGEVDKVGHPTIQYFLGAKKPDFVIHVPGDMTHNLVVIAVKSVMVKDKLYKLKKDLRTLQGFLDKAKYYRGIMLVYGNGEFDLPKSIRSEVDKLSKEYEKRILLVWHRGPGEEPVVI